MIKSLMNHFSEERFYTIDYKDIEKLIREVYKIHSYNIVAMEEAFEDSALRFDVEAKVDEIDREDIEDFLRGRKEYTCNMYMTGPLLNDMCNKGLIKPGKYLVEVCW